MCKKSNPVREEIVPAFFRVQEAAKYLSLSRSKVYQMCNEGILPTARMGGNVRVPRQAVEEYAAKALQAK